jgi:hypothetical protein
MHCACMDRKIQRQCDVAIDDIRELATALCRDASANEHVYLCDNDMLRFFGGFLDPLAGNVVHDAGQ